jgi:hypothetical protein
MARAVPGKPKYDRKFVKALDHLKDFLNGVSDHNHSLIDNLSAGEIEMALSLFEQLSPKLRHHARIRAEQGMNRRSPRRRGMIKN